VRHDSYLVEQNLIFKEREVTVTIDEILDRLGIEMVDKAM